MEADSAAVENPGLIFDLHVEEELEVNDWNGQARVVKEGRAVSSTKAAVHDERWKAAPPNYIRDGVAKP